MKIEIDTDGSAEGTVVKFNGELQRDLTEFNFSVKAAAKVKMQLVRIDERTSKIIPQSFYGGDFEKFQLSNVIPRNGVIGARAVQEEKK